MTWYYLLTLCLATPPAIIAALALYEKEKRKPH
jgi:predicted outer membrane lipoprotein